MSSSIKPHISKVRWWNSNLHDFMWFPTYSNAHIFCVHPYIFPPRMESIRKSGSLEGKMLRYFHVSMEILSDPLIMWSHIFRFLNPWLPVPMYPFYSPSLSLLSCLTHCKKQGTFRMWPKANQAHPHPSTRLTRYPPLFWFLIDPN